MSDNCCASACAPGAADTPGNAASPAYRRILWIALMVNAAMFGVELAGGLKADSVSLLADAVDFFGDAANYALSLAVLALAPVWRSRAALFKGVTMGLYGVFVLAMVVMNAFAGATPEPVTMGLIAALALAANVSVAALLYAYREGDANMRSVWLCSRNDAIGNVAVLLAALGVFGTGSAWPDLLVAVLMALLGLAAARSVITQAGQEMRAAKAPPQLV